MPHDAFNMSNAAHEGRPAARRVRAVTRAVTRPVALASALAATMVAQACNGQFFRVTSEAKGAAPPAVVVPPATVEATQQAAELPAYVEPSAASSDSAGIARLVRVALLWQTVSEHHPTAANQRWAWDGALVRMLPAIRAARNGNELADAAALLVGTLRDPLTRVERAGTGADDASRGAAVRAFTERDGIATNTPAASSVLIPLGDDVSVRIRTTADAVGATQPAMSAGLSTFASDSVPYPSLGARLLAGFRVWGIMRAGHAHRESYDDDVDAVFERVIPRLEAAQNREQHAAAIADFVSSFDDSQVALVRDAGDGRATAARAPFRTRVIEGRMLVTAVDGTTPGLGIGTEITSAEGFPISAWLLEHRRDVAASNEWTRLRDLAEQLPRGAAGSLMLRVRDGAGPERALSVMRTPVAADAPRTFARTTVAARAINDVVYADLERVSDPVADSLFAATRESRATILDLRGDVAASTGAVLRHFQVQPEFIAAQLVSRPAASNSGVCIAPTLREQRRTCPDVRVTVPVLLRASPSPYRGRLVVLIDERTQGAAERLALALQVGANATLIGSASAGAAAPTVAARLPGNLTLRYPVLEVRRSDGGQLHRVGLTPAIEVRPTVRGVRAGNDEVLDRANAWLQQLLDGSRRRR